MSYRIYDYILDPTKHDLNFAPQDIDYVRSLSVRLHPICTFDKGRIIKVEYYSDSTFDAYGESIPTSESVSVVREDYVYADDDSSFVRNRVLTITWLKTDGTDGDQKTRIKRYGNLAAKTEGERRRKNIIDRIIMTLVGVLTVTETEGDVFAAKDLGRAFLRAYNDEKSYFVEASATDLHDAVGADTEHMWLDNEVATGLTLRTYMQSELTI